jgi:hypothetical protein
VRCWSGTSPSSCPAFRAWLVTRSSGEEDSLALETFRGNSAGKQPRPAEPGQRPEASLAWWAGDRPCEAYTGRSNALRLSPEIKISRVDPSLCQQWGPRRIDDTWSRRAIRSRRGRRTGRMIMRVRRELVRPRRLRRVRPAGAPGHQLQQDPRRPSWAAGDETWDDRDGLARRRQRSAARWAAGSRSVSSYRRARGTVLRDPREGK